MSISEYDEWQKRFERFFRPAYREIELLDRKVEKKEGFVIFKKHKYTMDTLLNSEHHSKIDAVTKKIGDNLTNLYKRGKLPEGGKNLYEQHKYDVDEKLHNINIKIHDRKPTWLEQAWGLLEDFIEVVKENMPPLTRTMLQAAAIGLLEIPLFGRVAPVFSPVVERLLLPPADSGDFDNLS